jgi:hypothetical protein
LQSRAEACDCQWPSPGESPGCHGRGHGPLRSAQQGIVDSSHPRVRSSDGRSAACSEASFSAAQRSSEPTWSWGWPPGGDQRGALPDSSHRWSQRLPLRRHLLHVSTPGAPSSPTERGACRGRQRLLSRSGPEGPSRFPSVTTSRGTFGPGMPSPDPVPPLPFLTTTAACSTCAVQVCCTLQPTMRFAWFPAFLPALPRLHRCSPGPAGRREVAFIDGPSCAAETDRECRLRELADRGHRSDQRHRGDLDHRDDSARGSPMG